MNLEKNERTYNLLNVYGSLLTAKQQEVMHMFFNFDNTLVEIAEELNITRQGVFKTVQGATQTLEEFETKMHLLDKNTMLKQNLSEIIKETKDEVLKRKLQSVLEKI